MNVSFEERGATGGASGGRAEAAGSAGHRRRRSSAARGVLTWTAIGLSGLLTLSIAALIVAAYVITPTEVEDYESGYLTGVDSRHVETEIASYHYTITGSGPPVLLIHGGGTWLYTYREIIDDLALDRTVYAVDLPGHGYTELRAEPFDYDLASMVAAIEDFANALELDSMAVIGHSWGGGWALRFTQDNPERVTGLGLIAPSGIDYQNTLQWRLLGMPVVGEALSNIMRQSDVQNLLESSVFDTSTVTPSVVEEYWAPGSRMSSREALVALQRNLEWTQTELALAETTTPTLVLWGDRDEFAPHELAHRFGEEMPDASAMVFGDCGHSLHEECVVDVVPEIRSFLSGLDDAGHEHTNAR